MNICKARRSIVKLHACSFALLETQRFRSKVRSELCLPCAERPPYHPAACSDLRPLSRGLRARTRRSLLQQAPPRLQAVSKASCWPGEALTRSFVGLPNRRRMGFIPPDSFNRVH